ncbi:hypothetical protein AHAS_Ahas03G0326900 [Arachis hypogaea]
MSVWSIGWDSRLLACVYSGVVCFGIAYYVQGVVTRERGPVFMTSFSPLIMIITAVLGTIVLAEQIHLGSTTVLKGTIGYAPPGKGSVLDFEYRCLLLKCQYLNLQVNDPKVRNLLLGGQRIIWRFPSSIKASKLPKYEFTPTKGSLTSGKQNSHQIDTPAQPQTQVDMNLSAKLYSALRLLRATILGESGDNVLAHHVLWLVTQVLCIELI